MTISPYIYNPVVLKEIKGLELFDDTLEGHMANLSLKKSQTNGSITSQLASCALRIRQNPNFVPSYGKLSMGMRKIRLIVDDAGYFALQKVGKSKFVTYGLFGKILNTYEGAPEIWKPRSKDISAGEFFLRALHAGHNPANKIMGLYEYTSTTKKCIAFMEGKALQYSFNTHIKNIGFATSDILFEEAVLTAAARGDLASIKFFLNSSRDEAVFGEAMRIAASNGHGDIVDAIVQEYGRSLDLRSSIVSAAADGQTRILVKLLNCVEQFPPMCLKEALSCAAAKGKVASVAILLGSRYRHLADPAKALVTAASSGHANVIKLFLDTCVYDTETLGRSLVEAVCSGDEKSADVLIKNQAAVEFGGVEALKEATSRGLFDIVLKLLVRGVEVDDVDLLKIAAKRGHLKLVKYFFLCFRLYRPDVPNYKTIALDAASSFNNEAMCNFIRTDMNDRVETLGAPEFL